VSGNKRLASINTPAVMVIHTAAKTGADDKKPFNGVLLLNSFDKFFKWKYAGDNF
jgi:hypothetical protein